MTGLAVRKVSGRAKLKLVRVGPKVIGEGVLKLERGLKLSQILDGFAPLSLR